MREEYRRINYYILFLCLLMFKILFLSFVTNTVGYFFSFDILMLNVSSLILLSLWSLLLQKRGMVIYFAIVDVLLTVLVFINTLYFRYFGDLVSYNTLFHLKQIIDVKASLVPLLSPVDFLLILNIPFYFLILRKGIINNSLVPLKWRVLIITTLSFMFHINYTGTVFVKIEKMESILYEYQTSIQLYEKFGLIGYHFIDFLKYQQIHKPSNEEISQERMDQQQLKKRQISQGLADSCKLERA